MDTARAFRAALRLSSLRAAICRFDNSGPGKLSLITTCWAARVAKPSQMAIRPKVRAANVSPSILCRRLKREPAMGAMQEGEIVLVDDGSCPKGQIKRVVGGNHVKVGGYKQVVRTRSCVPR